MTLLSRLGLRRWLAHNKHRHPLTPGVAGFYRGTETKQC